MDLYIVQPGDTVSSIANKFNIPYEKLVYDNNIYPNYNIVNGQLILLAYPKQTYTVKQGDTLSSIAKAHGISVLELLQNNSYLSDRDYLNIGEELVISYDRSEREIDIDAFCFPFINHTILRKSLPFLTYLTIAGYRVTAYGQIESTDNTEIIQMAKRYGTAPIMLISTFSEQGRGSFGITNKIFDDEELQNKLIDNILYELRKNDLFGVNFGFSFVLPGDLQNYVNFIAKAQKMLKREGYQVFVTLEPKTFGFKPNEINDIPYFSQIGQVADAVVLLSYQWAETYIPTFEQTTVTFLESYVEYAITQIPPEKILVGVTRLAYDWELPYVEGESPVNVLTNIQALNLAIQTGATIDFNQQFVTPYYYYDKDGIQHFVLFKDARTINAILDLINKYNLKGISIWNIMDFAPQLWVTINSQYPAAKVLKVTSEFL